MFQVLKVSFFSKCEQFLLLAHSKLSTDVSSLSLVYAWCRCSEFEYGHFSKCEHAMLLASGQRPVGALRMVL